MSSLTSSILVSELDGPLEVPAVSSCLLTPLQPCQRFEAFLSFYTFPTWCFAGLRAACDGSIVCACFTNVKSCFGETVHSDLTAFVLTDGLISA